MDGSFYKDAFAALKGHQEAVLALAMVAVGLGSKAVGADPWFSALFPSMIYALYMFRMGSKQAHVERMAKLGVDQVERVHKPRIDRKLRRVREAKAIAE